APARRGAVHSRRVGVAECPAMRLVVRLATALTAASLVVSVTGRAQPDTVPGVTTPIVTTKHRMMLNGKPLAYTARAGVLPIRLNETDEPRGYLFFAAFCWDAAGGPP